MKKGLILICIGLLAHLVQGCKKDDNNQPASSFDPATVSTGTWAISSFTQRSENKTGDYAGMDFNFLANGTVTVTGAVNANGSWSFAPATTGNYGSSGSPARFTISIPGSAFSRLNRDWNVGQSTNNTLQLNHPETSEDEHVTFTRK